MSFVLCVCGSNFSLMMSDGRVTAFKENENSTKIICEDFKKIKRVNPNVIIGFTGDLFVGECIEKALYGYQLENLTMERIKRIIINKLKQNQSELNCLGAKIIISGINKSNIYTTYFVNSNLDFIETPYYVKDNYFAVVYACHNENIVKDIIQRNIYDTMPWKSIDILKRCMKQCIFDVAEIDNTVNKNVFEEMIL